MKTKRFLSAASLALAITLTLSCGSHNILDELVGDTREQLLGGKLQQLTSGNMLQNGNMGMGFVNNNIPAGSSVDVIKDVQVNGEAISGGSTSLTILSTERLKELYISIEGDPGYYVQPLTDDDFVMDEEYFSYFVVLQFYQQLEDDVLHFEVSGLTYGDEVVEKKEKEVPAKEVESGTLQISVSWDQFDDVDLHVFTPSGGHVYYGDKEAGNVKLDLDSNPACEIDEINSENIYIDDPMEDGEYRIEVRMYSKCGTNAKKGARYHVTANYKGTFIEFAPETQTGQFAASDTDDKTIVVGTIKVVNGAVVVE